jgi:hypothetical protein
MQKPKKGDKDYYKVILADRKVKQAKLQRKVLLEPKNIKLTKKQKEAYLGIFWFDINLRKLIFIQKKNLTEGVDTGGGWISADYYHADYWKTLDKKDIKANGGSPADYKSLPRGRVEFDRDTGEFVVLVGDWITYELIAHIGVEFKIPVENLKYETNDDYDYNISKVKHQKS